MTENNYEDIALFDMDGTLCDYEKALFDELERLRAPEEPVFHLPIKSDSPEHIRHRADLIMGSEAWWEKLPRFELGWDILNVAKELEFRIMILTQGPRTNPAAWSGKKRWIDQQLGSDVDITITRDKGLVYGRVLVDDYPPYAERWLKWRKRGAVIMPANNSNLGYRHPQVVRYDGSNLDEVRKAMIRAKHSR